jgi:DNA-binding transcriptional ArsR family regulator/uncharacterized protein YndB with AHSA1/START domain
MADDDLSPIWKALSDPTRRSVLDLLKDAPRTTGELAEAFPALSRFAVMKHLTVLEQAGLVLVRRKGRERWNYLNAVPIKAIAERWIGRYEDQWAGSLVRLKLMTESLLAGKDEAVTDPTFPGPIKIRTMRFEQEVAIAAPPSAVFQALTNDIGAWMKLSMYGGKVFLEPRLGGLFGERGSGDDGHLYGTVTRIKQDELLGLSAVMGMTGPVSGVLEYKLEAAPDGTVLKFSHSVIGDMDETTFGDYSNGWNDLLVNGLKTYLENRQAS